MTTPPVLFGARRTSWIIWYAIVLHFAWGFLLLASSDPLGIAGLATVHALGDGHNEAAGLVFVLASVAAAWDLMVGPSSLLMLMPQQLLLLLSAGDAVNCAFHSSYADGVLRPFPFILADQLPAILAASAHTAALFERYYWK